MIKKRLKVKTSFGRLMLSIGNGSVLIILDTTSLEEKQGETLFRNVKVYVKKQVLDEYFKNKDNDLLDYFEEDLLFLTKIQVEKNSYKEELSEADIELLRTIYSDMDKEDLKSYAMVLIDCLSLDIEKEKINKIVLTTDLIKRMKIYKEKSEEFKIDDFPLDLGAKDEFSMDGVEKIEQDNQDKYIPREARLVIAQKIMSSSKNNFYNEKQNISQYVNFLFKKGIVLEEDLFTINEYLNSYSDSYLNILPKILMLPVKSFSEVYTHEDVKNICIKLKDMKMNDKLVSILCGSFVKWLLKEDISRKPISFLIYGPPGTGKSKTARIIADLLSVNTNIISIPNLTELDLVGSNSTWRSAKQGLIADGLIKKQDDSKTTVFLIDEIDKALETRNIIEQLLSILDPEVEFKDIFLNISLDLGNAIVIMTANDIRDIPDYIISRTNLIEYKNPIFDIGNRDSNAYIINEICKILTKKIAIGNYTEDETDSRAIEHISRHILSLILIENDINSLDFRKLQSCVEYFINDFRTTQMLNNCFEQKINLREFYAHILRK